MSETISYPIKLTGLLLASALLTACSTSPLTCHRAIPSPQQFEQANPSIPEPSQASKAISKTKPDFRSLLKMSPSGMTLTAKTALLKANSNDGYDVTVSTGQITNFLAIHGDQSHNYTISMNANDASSFWKEAKPYLTHPFSDAVMTAKGLPSHIVSIDRTLWNGQTITYQVTSQEALQVGSLSDVTFTALK
jgi:hypothetical protein